MEVVGWSKEQRSGKVRVAARQYELGVWRHYETAPYNRDR